METAMLMTKLKTFLKNLLFSFSKIDFCDELFKRFWRGKLELLVYVLGLLPRTVQLGFTQFIAHKKNSSCR